MSKSKFRKLKQVKGRIRGDMYQPSSLLTLSIILLLISAACVASVTASFNIFSLLIALVFAALAVFMFLIWKNLKIKIVSKTQFESISILGKSKIYDFDDIKGLKKNTYVSWLYVGEDKLPVLPSTVISPKLIKYIDKAMGVK